MSLVNEASKLLTNKYFLYFMVFLSATNVLGYLVTNKMNAVIFFVLVSLITYQFSKNMSVILLIAVIATNFLMANKRMREGLENQAIPGTTPGTTASKNVLAAPALEQIDNKDKNIADVIPAVKKAVNNEQVVTSIQQADNVKDDSEPGQPTDLNNPDLNKSTEHGPTGVGQVLGSKKTKTNENFGPRLDYAATIEQSYANLDNLLGSDSIKQLTNDTQKLMQQQQNLFNTMNQMVPVLEGAQNMLKGFNIGDLANSLKGIGNLTGAPVK